MQLYHPTCSGKAVALYAADTLLRAPAEDHPLQEEMESFVKEATSTFPTTQEKMQQFCQAHVTRCDLCQSQGVVYQLRAGLLQTWRIPVLEFIGRLGVFYDNCLSFQTPFRKRRCKGLPRNLALPNASQVLCLVVRHFQTNVAHGNGMSHMC